MITNILVRFFDIHIISINYYIKNLKNYKLFIEFQIFYKYLLSIIHVRIKLSTIAWFEKQIE
jgi:hypothetical protein